MNERIEAVRKAQGLTQEQFAEKINLSRNYLWMLENGSRVPSDRTIKDICDKFGVCEEWLRTGEGEMTATDAQSDKIATFLADLTRDDDNNFKKRFVEMLADLQPKDWELGRGQKKKKKKKRPPRGGPRDTMRQPIRRLAYIHTSRSLRKSAFSSSCIIASM